MRHFAGMRSFVFLSTLSLSTWACASLNKQALPSGVSEVTPKSMGKQDLSELRELTKDAKIIALGEPEAASKDFTEAKVRILKTLVLEDGLRRIGLQDSPSAIEALDAYIQTGKGSPQDALAKTKLNGKNEGLAALLVWLKDYNQDNPKNTVHLFGFTPSTFAEMEALLSNLKIDVSPQNLIDLKACLADYQKEAKPGAESCDRCYKARDAYDLLPEPYLSRERSSYEARVKASCPNLEGNVAKTIPEGMSQLVLFDAKEASSPKTALWSTNTLVSRLSKQPAEVSMGQSLSKTLGKDYIPIQLLSGSYPNSAKLSMAGKRDSSDPISAEEWLSQYQRETLFVDLTRLSLPEKSDGPSQLKSAFDGIFFLRQAASE